MTHSSSIGWLPEDLDMSVSIPSDSARSSESYANYNNIIPFSKRNHPLVDIQTTCISELYSTISDKMSYFPFLTKYEWELTLKYKIEHSSLNIALNLNNSLLYILPICVRISKFLYFAYDWVGILVI